MGAFVDLYTFLGVKLTLETAVAGVSLVMTVRFTTSFIVSWLTAILRTTYVRELQSVSYDRALDARVGYFDEHGSDNVLNAIVTQATYAGRVITYFMRTVQETLLSLMYLALALYLAPWLAIGTAVVLGSIVLIVRYTFEGGYSLGDKVADANESVQQFVQAGVQGIRDVKLFGLEAELRDRFNSAIDQFAASQIRLRRNRTAMDNFYQLIIAVSVFVLIYAALRFTDMGIGSLGVFLFAMFRLGPRVSRLNNILYQLDGNLPHLIRTQDFIAELERAAEVSAGNREVPSRVDEVSFEDVRFSYGDEQVLSGLTFSVERGEFAAFVGPSGAGKSTIVSLVTRLYGPDDGEIQANAISIDEFGIDEWRSQVSVVRQNPHIFDDTLRYNVTVGNRHASQEAIDDACDIAQVTEFMGELPNGYETRLGDDGVRLSGGQRQRVAIARALLKDADVLILDEATSDLDSTLENRVHSGIEEMEQDCILLVIAHRLSTVTNADCISMLENGQIVESGAHDELMDAGGHYAELYGLQSN